MTMLDWAKKEVEIACERGREMVEIHETGKGTHTTDISHAVNFEKDLGGGYWEKEK